MPKFDCTVEVRFERIVEAENKAAALDKAWSMMDDWLDESQCEWRADVTDARGCEV